MGREGRLPEAYALRSYPNPFNSVVRISYDLVDDEVVSLHIYDVMGRRVRLLIEETQQAGSYEVEWDGRDDSGTPVASGVYQCEMRAGSHRLVEKMVLVK